MAFEQKATTEADVVHPETLEKGLEWRYATKVFDPNRKISARDWAALEKSLVLSPSSYGLQPWRFMVIENPKVRQQLREHSFGQTQITDASHLVVLTTLKSVEEKHVVSHIDRVADQRGLAKESLKGLQDMMTARVVHGIPNQQSWTQRQAYIAMGFLLYTAALLKVDACPMEGIDSAAYDKVLGLEGSDYSAVAVVALGYRSQADRTGQAAKVRFPRDLVMKYIA